ncbi:MAG: hypothetical protein K5686_10225, partial [Lachnospiraceae bacterium]|nr:hypothetical protein [Lachnospiraceae bacterium]
MKTKKILAFMLSAVLLSESVSGYIPTGNENVYAKEAYEASEYEAPESVPYTVTPASEEEESSAEEAAFVSDAIPEEARAEYVWNTSGSGGVYTTDNGWVIQERSGDYFLDKCTWGGGSEMIVPAKADIEGDTKQLYIDGQTLLTGVSMNE